MLSCAAAPATANTGMPPISLSINTKRQLSALLASSQMNCREAVATVSRAAPAMPGPWPSIHLFVAKVLSMCWFGFLELSHEMAVVLCREHADGASNQLFVFHLILAQLLKESVWDH